MSNPYQIRSDLLLLARDILESQSRAKRTQKTNIEAHGGTDIITTEQVIIEAQKLNSFVSTSNVVPGNLFVDGRVIARDNVEIPRDHEEYENQKKNGG